MIACSFNHYPRRFSQKQLTCPHVSPLVGNRKILAKVAQDFTYLLLSKILNVVCVSLFL